MVISWRPPFTDVSPPVAVHLLVGEQWHAGDISPVPLAAAFTGMLTPGYYLYSRATARSSLSLPFLLAPSQLSANVSLLFWHHEPLNCCFAREAPASDFHRVNSGFLACLLALHCQLGLLEMFPLMGCCHAFLQRDGKSNEEDPFLCCTP